MFDLNQNISLIIISLLLFITFIDVKKYLAVFYTIIQWAAVTCANFIHLFRTDRCSNSIHINQWCRIDRFDSAVIDILSWYYIANKATMIQEIYNGMFHLRNSWGSRADVIQCDEEIANCNWFRLISIHIIWPAELWWIYQ